VTAHRTCITCAITCLKLMFSRSVLTCAMLVPLFEQILSGMKPIVNTLKPLKSLKVLNAFMLTLPDRWIEFKRIYDCHRIRDDQIKYNSLGITFYFYNFIYCGSVRLCMQACHCASLGMFIRIKLNFILLL